MLVLQSCYTAKFQLVSTQSFDFINFPGLTGQLMCPQLNLTLTWMSVMQLAMWNSCPQNDSETHDILQLNQANQAGIMMLMLIFRYELDKIHRSLMQTCAYKQSQTK